MTHGVIPSLSSIITLAEPTKRYVSMPRTTSNIDFIIYRQGFSIEYEYLHTCT